MDPIIMITAPKPTVKHPPRPQSVEASGPVSIPADNHASRGAPQYSMDELRHMCQEVDANAQVVHAYLVQLQRRANDHLDEVVGMQNKNQPASSSVPMYLVMGTAALGSSLGASMSSGLGIGPALFAAAPMVFGAVVAGTALGIGKSMHQAWKKNQESEAAKKMVSDPMLQVASDLKAGDHFWGRFTDLANIFKAQSKYESAARRILQSGGIGVTADAKNSANAIHGEESTKRVPSSIHALR